MDDGVIVFGSQMPGDDDGIVALINRLFWLVVDEENLSPADGVERLTDLIAGYTGMAIDEVKKDVDRSLSTQIQTALRNQEALESVMRYEVLPPFWWVAGHAGRPSG